MALVELSHNGTTFASITEPDGSVTLNTKDKLVDDYIKVEANITDPNLIPSNIKENVSIFGVTGNLASKNAQKDDSSSKITNKTSFTAVGGVITVAKTGTYNVQWFHYAVASSSSFYNTILYVNGSAVGTQKNAPIYSGTSGWIATEENLQLNAGDEVQVRAKTRSGTSYWTVAGGLCIQEV